MIAYFKCGWRFYVNCIKIYSIILSVTCHGLRNFAPLIHSPTYPFVNFQNPMSNYCLPSFEYKNNCYYFFIIIIVLYSQLYQKIITRCSLYKNLNGMIITLVPREKSRKVACVLNGTEMLSPKAITKKACFLKHYPERKHRTPNLWQIKLFSENFHSPPQPYMTHLTPSWPTPPLHKQTHPNPT